MKTPKRINKELKRLWKMQYAPRDYLIKEGLKNNKKKLNEYKRMSITKKIILIDRMQSKGFFDNLI